MVPNIRKASFAFIDHNAGSCKQIYYLWIKWIKFSVEFSVSLHKLKNWRSFFPFKNIKAETLEKDNRISQRELPSFHGCSPWVQMGWIAIKPITAAITKGSNTFCRTHPDFELMWINLLYVLDEGFTKDLVLFMNNTGLWRFYPDLFMYHTLNFLFLSFSIFEYFSWSYTPNHEHSNYHSYISIILWFKPYSSIPRMCYPLLEDHSICRFHIIVVKVSSVC